ncbi:MAG: CHAT domain-containing protein [Burkholderiaceae bacterium]|nr:CHAT domain-containing protein [Burkholderiaceae bacterium]
MADDVRAAGWALKQACYDAWHRDPAQARDAARRLAELAAVHPANTEVHALAAWTAGIGALTNGRLAEALEHLRAAQAAFEALHDVQHAAETRVPQIAVLAVLGRHDEAQACAEAALAQFVAGGDERSAGKVELNLANLLFRQDRHAEAEPRYRAAALRFARVGDTELSIMADGALANVLGWQFRFDEALQMFERARQRAQAQGYGVLVAQMHQGIGQIELLRGRWPRALHELATGARLAAETGGSPQRRLEAEAALADAYLAVNLIDEAVALYARLIDEAAALPAPTEQAWATLQRSRALARLGETASALEGFAQAQRLYEAAGNTTVLGLVALGRGRVELVAGDTDAARASAAQALAALASSGIVGWQLEARLLDAAAQAAAGDAAGARAGFERIVEQAHGAHDLPQVAWQGHAGLAALAFATGDVEGARRAAELALGLMEQARAALPGDDLRSAVGAETETAQRVLVEVAVAAGDAAHLMLAMERGRARALAIALGGDGPAGTPVADDGAARVRWLRQQWQQAASEGDAERAPALAARVQALEHELLEAHRRVRLGAEPAETRGADATFDGAALAALQRALGADRALVAFQMLGERLLACVVTADAVSQRVWPAGDLAARIRSLRFQLDTLRFGSALAQRHGAQLLARTRSLLQQLHASVWAPVAPLLGGRARVVVLPHRDLHYLPFAALHDGGHWLVQTHEIALAPSAAVWLALQRRAPPRFDSALVLGIGGAGLPHVAAEVAAVAAAFGGRADIRVDGEATHVALEERAGDADVLHLACHGRFRADNPAFSLLQLGDGPLTLHDAAQLRLRAGLVTLSACETGASRVAAGDEVLGLVRAFLLAGAGAVLATQWPVDDAATAALVGDFYAGLANGAAPAAALRQVQAAAAEAGRHPFHWAAFALHGRG